MTFRTKPSHRRTPLRRTGWPKRWRPFATPLKANQRGKYGSYSATYNGRTYHSRKEALYAAELDLLRKAYLPKDRVVKVEPQINVDLVVNGKKVCRIIPDFRVTFADGRVEWHEVKSHGTMTREWYVKKRLFEALFPNETYRVIL